MDNHCVESNQTIAWNKCILKPIQKQWSRDNLKRCSENMQQIYRRTPMPKCDFNKSNFIEIALRHGYSLVNLLHISRTPCPKNTSGQLLLHILKQSQKHLDFSRHKSRYFNFIKATKSIFISCMRVSRNYAKISWFCKIYICQFEFLLDITFLRS